MSIIPIDSVLQYSNSDYSIYHQNIIGGNIQGTDYVNGFPTTNTGSSVGMYQHLGKDGSNNNRTDNLNVSGLKEGGFNFWTSNSNNAPILLNSITKDGVIIDKSIAGTLGIDLPNVTASGAVYVIFASSINSPPWNITGVGNPITVKQNTAHMSTGITYYLTGLSSQAGQVFLNIDGTGPVDTSDLASFTQPILVYGQSTPPVIRKEVLSADSLQITYDLSKSTVAAGYIKTENGSTYTFQDTTHYQVQNGVNNCSMTYNGVRTQYGNQIGLLDTGNVRITDGDNNREVQMTSYNTYYNDIGNNRHTRISTPYDSNQYETFKADNTNSIISLKVPSNAPILNLTNNTDFCNLTNNDITFNNISLKNAVKKLQYSSPINVLNSTTITGTLPSSPPMVFSPSALAYGYSGWFFRNYSSSYSNIGWTLALSTPISTPYNVSNLKGFYFNFMAINATSTPFMTVYTLPPVTPNFFNSRRSYVPSSPTIANTPYTYYFMFDSTYPTPTKFCHTPISLSLSSVGQVGTFAPNEPLYFFSVNTNSISAPNTEEFIVSEAGVIIDDGSGVLVQPYSFNPADINKINGPIIQGAGTLTPNLSNNKQIYILTGDITISNTALTGTPAGFCIIFQANSIDRTITYNTLSTKVLHTNSGSTNGGQIIAYWTGTLFTLYQ